MPVTSSPPDSGPPTRAADGRIPGTRGQATRERLLDATNELLDRKGYRDLRVADIARVAGTSPATFYQYFAGSEDALLELMTRVVEEVDQRLRSQIADSATRTSRVIGEQLAEGFLDIWARHRALLGVVDLVAAEGDGPVHEARVALLNPVSIALEKVIEAQDVANGRSDRSAKAAAFVLVAMLSNVASHQDGMLRAGATHDSLSQAMADQIVLTIG